MATQSTAQPMNTRKKNRLDDYLDLSTTSDLIQTRQERKWPPSC